MTGLQRAFVDAWFGDAKYNGTEAARMAGYSGGDDPERWRDVWAVQANQVLRNTKVQKEIANRWAAHGAGPEEVAARLIQQMRSNPADFFDENGLIDLDKIKRDGSGIVKSLTIRKGNKIEIQMESPQRATELIGKTMGMFVSKVALTDPTGEKEFSGFSDDERLRRIEALLAANEQKG